MITSIMLLNGFTDYAGLIAVFAVNASMILFGALQEKYEKPGNGKALPFIMGCMTGIVPWIIIGISAFRPGYEGDNQIPGFVIGIIVTIFKVLKSSSTGKYIIEVDFPAKYSALSSRKASRERIPEMIIF